MVAPCGCYVLTEKASVLAPLKRNQLELYIGLSQRIGTPHWSRIAMSVFRPTHVCFSTENKNHICCEDSRSYCVRRINNVTSITILPRVCTVINKMIT